MTLSIGDTAVAGLRVFKNRPLTLLYWIGLALLVTGAGAALMYGTGLMTLYQQLMTQSATGTVKPEELLAMFGRVAGVIALMIPVYLLYFAASTTAAVRAVLEPEKGAFGYLRLGAAELRTLAVIVVVWVLIFLAYLGIAFVFAIVIGAAGVAAGSAGGGSAAGGVAMVLLIILMFIAIIVGLVWFAVRMSLAVPQTFDTRSVNIFGTWKITKGNTGKLFLAYLLAFLIYLGVSIVGGLLNVALMGGSLASLGASTNAADVPDVAAVFERMGPAMVVNMLVSGVVSAIGTAVMVCPAADAYLQLANRAQRDAEVFA